MFDTVLDEIIARDAALAVSQCLKGVLEEMFDRDAEWSVSQGCCIVCLTGMLNECQGCWMKCLIWMLYKKSRQGSWIVCSTWMLNWVFAADAELVVCQGCWIECLTGMTKLLFDR